MNPQQAYYRFRNESSSRLLQAGIDDLGLGGLEVHSAGIDFGELGDHISLAGPYRLSGETGVDENQRLRCEWSLLARAIWDMLRLRNEIPDVRVFLVWDASGKEIFVLRSMDDSQYADVKTDSKLIYVQPVKAA